MSGKREGHSSGPDAEGLNTSESGVGVPEDAPTLAEARIVKREGWSIVWLIPLVALIIGLWLAYHAISQRGPTITIEFSTASGLQAGKTKVKFKDVVIGQVTAISLSDDLEKVFVTAELTRGSEDYLTEKTRFWVARPRVTPSQVTGLETLLSGAYVAIDPVLDGKSSRHFVGLKDPPVITTSEHGTQFSLRAETLGSLNLGSPVYFRHIQVGQVVNYRLDQDGGAVTIDIFVVEPNDRLVYGNTRFWNASGVDVRMSADGISIDTESLVSLLIGGVVFDTPDMLDHKGAPAKSGQFFPLYENRAAAHERAYLDKQRFVLLFEESVRGLSRDAPVLLRGIQVGQVLDIRLIFDDDRMTFQIPVLIEIEPERIGRLDSVPPAPDEGQDPLAVAAAKANRIESLVADGLRAQLKTGSLLTGQLYVEFDLHADAAPAEISEYDGYKVLPTLPNALEAATTKVNRILSEVESIPFGKIGADVSAILDQARQLAESGKLKTGLARLDQLSEELVQLTGRLDQEMAPQVIELLKQTQSVLTRLNTAIAPESPLSVETLRSMRELQSAARAVRVLADYLERHPEALLKGKAGMR